MNIVLACSPQESTGLLELTLEAAGVQFEYFERVPSLKQLACMDLMILDPDQPGQDFLLRYRKLHDTIGAFPVAVLGNDTHSTMRMIPWDESQTVFLGNDDILENLAALLEVKLQGHSENQEPLLMEQSNPVPETRTIELFKGLKNIHAADILQMLCVSRWSGEVRVYNKELNRSGTLSIREGDIHHAVTDESIALQACYEMLSWKGCEFHFLETSHAYPRTIRAGWEAILMEAAVREDESSHQDRSEVQAV